MTLSATSNGIPSIANIYFHSYLYNVEKMYKPQNRRAREREKIVPDVALESNVKGQCWGDLERHSSLVFLGCYVRTRFFRLLPSWGQFPFE